MDTTEPNRETNPDAGILDLPSGQTTAGDDPTQPSALAPEPMQAPPTTPASQPPVSAGESPVGGALWLAFAFGVSVAIFWSLARTGLAQIDQPLQLSLIGGHHLWLFALIAVSIDLALPIVIIAVAWRTRRSAGAPTARSVLGALVALVALVALTVGPGALVYALSLTSATAPLGAALVNLLFPGYPVKFFASLSLDVSAFASPAIVLALPAAYAWGGQWRRAATGSANSRLVVVRWMAVGLSAPLGYNVYQFASGLIFFYFLVIPGMLRPQLSLFATLQPYTFAPTFILSVFGGVVGGALSGVGGGNRAEATGAQTPAARRPLGWRRAIAVGALLLALGLVTSAWLPATLIILTHTTSAPPMFGLLGVAALAPTLIIIVALTVVFRRLGARSGWRTLGVAMLSYAPLVIGVIGLGLLQRLNVDNVFSLLLSDAPVVLLFGVGVALAVVFGAADSARWRGRAAAIGVALGVGYALLYTILAIAGRTTQPGACNGVGGCGLQAAFNAGIANLLAGYALEGLALALLGATVGGWLRVSRAR